MQTTKASGPTTQTVTIQPPTNTSTLIHLHKDTDTQEKKKVKWEEDVVDNEFMNKKKSKSMCVCGVWMCC